MPNILNENGLQTKTVAEIRTGLENKMKAIYGTDINLGPSSYDAQMINIYTQANRDFLDALEDSYQSFDPDQATGVVLDMRVGLNGIQRKQGTNTVTMVRVVTDAALTLYGVDQELEEVFTVADDAGTQFVLGETVAIPGPGTYDLIFQSEEEGQVEVQPNTITEVVTVTIGVVSVNNPNDPISTGINQEIDPDLRERRIESVAISGKGWKDSLKASLRNINGINIAEVFENKTAVNPDTQGIPSHSIWVIVSGVYTDQQVAQAIYEKRNAGAGMKGSKSYAVIDDDGNPELMKWDDATTESLFIQMTITPIDPLIQINIDGIKNSLAENMKFKINGTVNANSVACQVQGIDSNALVTAIGFSLLATGPFLPVLKNSSLDKIFSLVPADIIVLPMDILPKNVRVVGGITPETRQFKAFGGYGSYTWSILVDNSGAGGTAATIDSQGVYVPGDANVGVFDTIKAVDSQGAFATVQVEVIAP